MKKILFFLAFIPAFALAQVDNTIDKGSGWLYFSGIPGTTPSVAAGSEVAINALTREAYIWNRDSSAWQKWLLIDSLTYAGDTLRLYQNGEAVPLSVEITAGSTGAADGNGLFDAANDGDTIRVSTALLRASLTYTQSTFQTVFSGNNSLGSVRGTATSNGAGVYGSSSSGNGVYAESGSGIGLFAK
jgi:hypothetical protein